MQAAIIFFIIQYVMYSNFCNYVIGNPMLGPNVRDAVPGQFEYIVSLNRVKRNGTYLSKTHICTGSLITRMDILTAAHCVEKETIQRILILIGSIDLKHSTPFVVDWWITYNEWAHLTQKQLLFRVNDIANIRLRQPVSSNINVVALCSLPIPDLYNLKVVIAGWGRNENHVVPDRMRLVELKVLEMTDCLQRVKDLNDGKAVNLHERHICSVGDPYAIMYWGDSGAPVIYQNMILGIHKSTIPFPGDFTNPRKINVHTTIYWYRDFIAYVSNIQFKYIRN